MLALAKRAVQYDREVRKGNWNIRFDLPAYDLAGRKMLILGFGRIGRRLVKRCVAMEMDVMVYDPYVLRDVIFTAGATPVLYWGDRKGVGEGKGVTSRVSRGGRRVSKKQNYKNHKPI